MLHSADIVRVATRTQAKNTGYYPILRETTRYATSEGVADIAIDLAKLRARILETTKEGAPFTRRSLSMKASDGRNPDLVRDLMRVNLRKPTIETVVGLCKAWGDDVGLYIGGVVPSSGKEFLTVRGAVAAGVWKEQAEWSPEDWYQIEVGPSPVGGVRSGLVVEGRSMDRTFPPGTVLDCIDLIGSSIEVQDGDYVIVERVQGALRETTVKRLDLLDSGSWQLTAESSLPEFAEPMLIGQPDFLSESDDETRVKALVIWAHRPLFKMRHRKKAT